MKKFLVILMVVAMASFLFVGCLGTTPPIEPDEPVEPVLPSSITPVITAIDEGGVNLYSSKTQYVNSGFLVEGSAPKYSKIRVYVGGVVVSTGYAWGVTEEFKIFVPKTSLGLDGAKTLYATATETGLDESDPSITYKFTLDTVAPKIVSVAAEGEDLTGDIIDEKAVDVTLTVTFSEALKKSSVEVEDEAGASVAYGDLPWTVKYLIAADADIIFTNSGDIELVSAKVVEIECVLTIVGAAAPPAIDAEGEMIRVDYDEETIDDTFLITDLAGNELPDSVHYCFLELAD